MNGMHMEERVSLDRRSRRITVLERSWRVADSVDLLRQEDSIARALVRRGGERIQCPLPFSTQVGTRSVSAWRFQDQDVRVITSRWGDAKQPQPEWLLQVSGFPVGYSGCQEWVRTRRLLSPTEMLTALHHWLVEESE
jgi:hypothetical protein